jgi:hypothetical protein
MAEGDPVDLGDAEEAVSESLLSDTKSRGRSIFRSAFAVPGAVLSAAPVEMLWTKRFDASNECYRKLARASLIKIEEPLGVSYCFLTSRSYQ